MTPDPCADCGSTTYVASMLVELSGTTRAPVRPSASAKLPCICASVTTKSGRASASFSKFGE